MDEKKNIINSNQSGVYDILPEQVETWDYVVNEIRNSLNSTGYHKMVSSITEKEDTFSKKILEALNLPDKHQLLTIRKRNKDSLVMTPPGPVSLLRSALEQEIIDPEDPLKVYHYGVALVDEDNDDATEPFQFHVFKVESIGDLSPVRDAEMILTMYRLLEELGLKNLVININSLGTKECRESYYNEMCSRAGKRYSNICQRYRNDPIRLYAELQSQVTEMNLSLPLIVDHLAPVPAVHFKATLEFLDTLEMPYVMNPTMRGSYGFNDTTYFEIVSQDEPEIVLARGGRHNVLLQEMGGSLECGAVGAEIYVDTILKRIWKEKQVKIKKAKAQVFIASIGQEGQKNALKILSLMQKQGVEVVDGFGIKSLKEQIAKSKKHKAPITIIIGRKEALDGTVILRDKMSDNQETVPIDKLLGIIQQKLSDGEKV